jgi:hypothetical protein
MLISAVLMAVVLVGGDPDGIVTTAPATTVDLEATARPTAPSVAGAAQAAVPHGLSTDQQIDRWLDSRSVADAPWAEAATGSPGDRRMHGQVTVGIGTEGYRDFGAAVSLPIGETGWLDISYRQVRNGYPYGGYDPYGYGDSWHDYGGFAFPRYRPGAVPQFEGRVMRQGGPQRAHDSQPVPTGDR